MQTRLRTALVSTLCFSTLFGHIVYPLAMAGLAKRRGPWVKPPQPNEWPAISVIIPAYREAGCIEAKVKDIVANGYGGTVEVIVIAEDDDTADAARKTEARVIQPETRLGKAGALNLGWSEASHDYLVMTDANNTLGDQALALLIEHLVDGWDVAAGEKTSSESVGENAYWRFESWLKQQEHRAGNSVGVVGELFALKRDVWRGIPSEISCDDVWVVCDAIEHGERIAYVHEAKAFEPPVENLDERWERRTRIITNKMWVFAKKPRVLSPRFGVPALQLWGHLFWRASGGPLSHLALLIYSVVRLDRSNLARLFVLGHAFGFLGMWLTAIGRRLPSPLAIPVQALQLQVVAIAGLIRVARGDKALMWKKIER